MSNVRDLASASEGLFVVETYDGDAFLGELAFDSDVVAVHNGFVGRPPKILRAEIRSIVPAADHPDVVFSA